MGHPRKPALYASAALLAIVVIALLIVRWYTNRPPVPRLPEQAPAVADPGSKLEELAPPTRRDLDWRAAVQAEPAAPSQAARAPGDPERAAHVFGFVHAPNGLAKSVKVQWNAKPQYTLRVQFARPLDSIDPPAETRYFDVVDGRFEGDIGEGMWIVGVVGTALTEDLQAYTSFASPVPKLRRLAAGSRMQIDLDFRPAGTCTVEGTILDENGQPFGGLGVQVSELHDLVEPTTRETVTVPHGVGSAVNNPASGAFAVSRMPPGRFRLWVEPEGYKPMSPPGVGTIGRREGPRDFVVEAGNITLDLTVRRPHPVHVTGRVEVDAAWAAEHGLAGQVPNIELLRDPGPPFLPEIPDRRDRVELGPQGFDFWIEASVGEPRLELRLGTETLVLPLALTTKGEFAPLTIRFPR